MLPVSTALNAMAAANWRVLATKVLFDLNRTGDPEQGTDVTNYLTDWHAERTIATDVPAAARYPTGFVSAEFTANLGGRDELGNKQSPGRTWSPYAPGSLTNGKDVTNMMIRPRAGLGDGAGNLLSGDTNGPPRGTFFADTFDIQAEDDDVVAYDGMARLGNDTAIPMMGNSYLNSINGLIGGVRPNLSCGAVLDFSMRQNGYYMSPPPRNGCCLSVPAHGTLYPEPGIGWLDGGLGGIEHGTFEQTTHATTVSVFDGTMVQFDHIGVYAGGPAGDNGLSGVTPSTVPISTGTSATNKDYKASWQPANTTLGGTSTTYANFFASGKSVTYEAWVLVPATPPQGHSANQPMWGLRFRQNFISGQPDTAHVYSSGILCDGSPYLSVGDNYTLSTGSAPGLTGWVYLLVTITNNGSNTTATVRYGLPGHASLSSTQTVTVADTPQLGGTGSAGQFRVQLCTNRVSADPKTSTGVITSFEALQVTNEASPSHNLGFKPTAFMDYSLSPLVCTPNSATTGAVNTQQLVTDLTAAELGMSYMDEWGHYYFFNRARWGRSPGNTPVVTLTSDNQLEALQITHNTQGVINDVDIAYSAYGIQKFQQVYQLGHLLGVHSGATVSYIADLSAPVLGLDLGSAQLTGTGSLPPLPAGTITSSGYRASWWEDGTQPSGSGLTDPPNNVSVRVQQIAPTRVVVTVTNNESNPIYLVSGDDQADASRGTNFVFLFGRPIGVANDLANGASSGDGGAVYHVADTTKQNPRTGYGIRNYTSSANDWLQSLIVATNVGNTLLAQLKDPHPLIQNVQFKAHPGLQVGDRVILQDTAGTQLDTTNANIGTVLVELSEDWAMDDDLGGGGYTMTGTFRLMDMSAAIT